MVEYFELSDDLRISRVLTGLWQIADMEREGRELDSARTAEFMKPYVDSGFTTFDMADHYGSAELIAGQLKQDSAYGSRVQLLTKWVPSPGVTTIEQVKEAVQRALDRLNMEHIDLLQYHAWNYADPEWLDTMFWLQQLKNEGIIKNIGVTNFDAAHLRIACASGIEVVSNQISHSVIDQRARARMYDVCDHYGVSILAFGTLAGGFLSERWLGEAEPGQDELITWSQMKYKRFIDHSGGWATFQSLLSVLNQIANKHGCSIANVASRFVLDSPRVAGVILGARLGVRDHVQENRRLFEIELDRQDQLAIEKAIAQRLAVPGNCGDEYRKPPFLTASGDLSHHIDGLTSVYAPVRDQYKTRVDSGTVWEDIAGYSRAVRFGDRIQVSGTTATHGDKLIGGDDAAAQTHFVIDKVEAAITSLGGKLEEVTRTRVYINNIGDWEAVSRAHGERFKEIRPANTLVQAGLIGDGYLVEIEAEVTASKP